MAATVENFILKGCLLLYPGAPSLASKTKFRIIASRYSTLNAFKNAQITDFEDFKTVEGTHCFRPLRPKEIEAISTLQKLTSVNLSLEENFIKLLTTDFINKQINMLDEITVDKLNSNPMLCKALNFQNSGELVRYNAYSAISRSIVTSMGFLIQNLLLYSCENAYDGKEFNEGNDTKFDVVIAHLDGIREYIELKSGPNDLDAAQVKHYAREIAAVEHSGHKGFIGIAYGKRETPAVSFGLLESYLPDWLNKTLIGQELWDHVTQNPKYHDILMSRIEDTARATLGNDSLIIKIEDKIIELMQSFNERYKSLNEYYQTLW